MSELIVDKVTAKLIQSDTFNLANTALNVLNTTQSVSTSTGSITPKGGLGILGAANIGGDGNIGGSATIGGGANISGVLTISNNTQSATTSTGSIVAYGGIGIVKNANIGGNTVISGYLDINSSVASSNTGTGSITTNGGIGILGDANIGGSATIGGLATCATAPILGQHLCNKTYVDAKIAAIPKSGFGDYVAIGTGTFFAATDGFVMANFVFSEWPVVWIWADKFNPPTTLRQHHSSDDDGGSQQSILCPIPKGYYYKIARQGGGHINMFWLPVG